MKVILLSDVKKVGKKGDIVDVSDGYARNFLLNKNLGVLATKKSMEILDEENAQHAAEEKQKEVDAQALKTKLESITLEFHVKAGDGGRVFGGVSTKQIVEQLREKHGLKVDKRKVIDTGTIASLGY
ncbi:MAG: 50S ribosomal protein L9, partial [Longicatena sp.]